MKVLLDEDVPRLLKAALTSHEAFTVQDMGWAGVQNGRMLALAEGANFDVLVTAHRNLPFQQNVQTLGLAIVMLAVPNKKIETILPTVPLLLATLERDLQRGTVTYIGDWKRP